MTCFPAIHAVTIPQTKYPPRWYSRRDTPYSNEGDPITITIWCLNPIPNAQVQVWFTGGNSLAGGGNYLESWHVALARACSKVGCTYTANGGSPSPHGSLWGLIVCGPNYTGEDIVATVVTRRNRRTDASPIYGGPGYREMQLLLASQAGINGLTAATAGAVNSTVGDIGIVREPDGTQNNVGRNIIRVYDTSKRPSGSPTFQLASFAADGVSAIGDVLEDGDEVVFKLLTANMLPGTQVKIYAANDAQKQTAPDIRDVLPNAAKAAGNTYSIVNYTEETKKDWYRGATIIYESKYSDAKPVQFTLKVRRPASPDGRDAEQYDLVAQIVREGTAADMPATVNKGDYITTVSYSRGNYVRNIANGAQYIWTNESSGNSQPPYDDAVSNSNWRLYDPVQVLRGNISKSFKDATPRYWEARATRNADGTLRYAIHGPANDAGASVVISQAGTADLPGFAAALATAADAHPVYSYDPVAGRLYCTSTLVNDPDLVFNVPAAVRGKHIVVLSGVEGKSPITIGEACVFMTPPVLPADPVNIYGVNVSGGEFASGSIYGTNYRYPHDPSDANPAVRYEEIDYQWSKGARIFRIPYRWYRVQPVLFGDLYGDAWPGAVGVFPANERMDILRLENIRNYILAKGPDAHVIFDCHSYMDRDGGKIGYDQLVPIPALIDFHIKFINRLDAGRVWFDLMNEPNGNGQGANRCRENMQWMINAIRGRTDCVNKILIEGQRFSSSQYWVNKGQADAYADFYDPAGNSAFSPHCYLDETAGGYAKECVLDAWRRLVDATEWARAQGVRLFLGEIGFSGVPSCAASAPQALAYLRKNPDVWIGFTAWAAGRRWGGEAKYDFALDPQNYLDPVDSGPMKILLPYLGN